MEQWNESQDLPSLEVLVEDVAVEELSMDVDLEDKVAVIDEPVLEPAIEDIIEEKPVEQDTKKHTAKHSNKVIIYSLKDIFVNDKLSILKGYSEVSESDSEEILKNRSIRLARPEEIDQYFNK
jgi:hypothetical protein